MNADFCVEVLKEALAKYDTPEIFNTDQGSQFTSGVWHETMIHLEQAANWAKIQDHLFSSSHLNSFRPQISKRRTMFNFLPKAPPRQGT